MFDLEKIAAGVRLILEGIGEDLNRPGIAETPQRVAEMYQEICGGLHESVEQEIKVIPAETHDEIVMVRDIPIYSICEHHLVPFTGRPSTACSRSTRPCSTARAGVACPAFLTRFFALRR